MASEKLTAMKASQAREPGLLSDGRGLYLRIAAGGRVGDHPCMASHGER